MRSILAKSLDSASFAPFGRYWSKSEVRSGNGYSFSSTLFPEFRGGEDEEPSLGITTGDALDTPCISMERHFHTSETLFTICAPVVLCVAPSGGDSPRAELVQAFLLVPGELVRLNRGVWHDACRGLTEPVTYGWLADCRAPLDPWVEVVGGPLRVVVNQTAQ